MMSFLVCLWPGKRGKERRWFRWGERLRVSVSCCGEEKKKKKASCRKTGQEKLILCQFLAHSTPPFEHENCSYL
jgi:hypothetical protein